MSEHPARPASSASPGPAAVAVASASAGAGAGADRFDLVVIGGGPGGYMAALRAAQLGLRTALVDRERVLGGTCLRIGCIPSKALLASSQRYAEARGALADHGVRVGEVTLDLAQMMARKTRITAELARGLDHLIAKAGITRFHGHARLAAGRRVAIELAAGGAVELGAGRILLATGSKAATLRGVELDGDRVATSTEALAYPEVPRHLVVIGAGAIGLELGSVWRRLGAEVTVLELEGRILPGMDRDLASGAEKALARQGLAFRLGRRVRGARRVDEGGEGRCRVEVEGEAPIDCDRVLLATGRVPCTDGLGLDAIGLALDARGRIPVDARFETAVPGVFAIGDAIHGPMLAHKASEEGVAAVEGMAGGHAHVDPATIPAVVYTDPEVAAVGATEDDLEARGAAFRKGVFPFRALGRARAGGHPDGFVKLLADARTDRILGVHILGEHAGDLIAEAAAAMAFGASAEDLALVCHPHPTLSEALKEAALASLGRALHT